MAADTNLSYLLQQQGGNARNEKTLMNGETVHGEVHGDDPAVQENKTQVRKLLNRKSVVSGRSHY